MSYRSGYAALVGRPNVGKSTLMNRLLGQKLAITSHKPQTTRHRIMGIRSQVDGQIIFVDTPGIHARGNKAMNFYLNRAARSALQGVDVILFVIQALAWTEEDELVLKAISEAGLPTIAVVNKVDLVPAKEKLLPFIQELAGRYDFVETVPISAQDGDNVEVLARTILDRLPAGEPIFPDDQISERSERFFAAELLREQLIRRYHQELPYALTVEIERFEEVGGQYRISAVIWVERDSQRAILLGTKGSAMKETATAARKAMNEFFQTRVHLDVWIKVKKSWSSDESSMAKLGYTD